jgi:uncharacterized protein (TIGR03435 family)
MQRLLKRTWILFVAGALGFAQDGGLKFEVASVRPSPPIPANGGVYFGPPRGGPGTPDPEQIAWTYATLKSLLLTAYAVKNYQVNGPAWLDTERYDIAVKVSKGATKEQVNLMWRDLLAERFGIVLHHEPKEFRVEELVVAPGGAKLKESAENPDATIRDGPPRTRNGELLDPGMVATIFPSGNGAAKVRTVAKAQPISQLTNMLGNQLGRPVLDKTGLSGRYDFELEYGMDLRGFPPPPGQPPIAATAETVDLGPSLADVVQQKLGLKLVAGRAQLDVLVIDKAEKAPTSN